MTDPTDNNSVEEQVELQTIQEVMAAVQAQQRSEMQAQREEQLQRKRAVREERLKEIRERRQIQAKDAQAARTKALKLSTDMITREINGAMARLRAARRAASQFPLPRHSPEAKEAARMVRNIEAAMAACRQIGRGTFYEPDVDLDLDADLDVTTD